MKEKEKKDRGELPITAEEFRRLCTEDFLKSAWEGTEERAKKFLETEDADYYIEVGYSDFVFLWKDEENYQRQCGHLKFEDVCKAQASAVVWNMLMSY